eukprot:TRINITY_DN4647_c0_g1_i3.p1 TRINITY_DN4647_c0_g1~~TRINITY_DN4647_c0_g1_i3.p1  ORF type:complete len:488 (-),score=95.74 TRINITY_DN4647_c0_g1_i3:73-1443(-)
MDYLGSLLEHPFHLVTEVVLVLFVVYLWVKESYKVPTPAEKLTIAEEDELIEDWQPDPLVPHCVEESPVLELLVEGPVGAHTKVNGKMCINLVSNGVLELQNHQEVKKDAIETSRMFGVGSCGPRGFYGSLKPHLDFEKDIAEFMQMEGGLLYPSDFQTVATIIPAFSKSPDYIVVEKGCSFAIQNGLNLSRSHVLWFENNDMQDLERVLATLKDVFVKKVNRVFLVVEAISSNYGRLLPLPRIMELKRKYPFRIILDESYSIGVLGRSGRGITEHFGITTSDIEIIVASSGNALGSVGGFAVSQREIIAHQSLNCTGYVYSCASPPFTSAATSTSLRLLSSGKVKPSELWQKVSFMHEKLKILNKIFENVSHGSSPFIHLRLRARFSTREVAEKKLKELVDKCFEDDVLVVQSHYSSREKFLPDPGLRLAVSIGLTEKDIETAVNVIFTNANRIF